MVLEYGDLMLNVPELGNGEREIPNKCIRCQHFYSDFEGNKICRRDGPIPLDCQMYKLYLQSLEKTESEVEDQEIDMVSHPPHYQTSGGLETIDVIEAFTENLEGIEAVCTGNAIKYICRWKHKNGVEDLNKAIWYIQHLVDYISKN